MTCYAAGLNRLVIGSLMDDLAPVFTGLPVGVVYTDPPWSESALTSFYHQADTPKTVDMSSLLGRLAHLCQRYSPDVSYVEMGKQFNDELERQFKTIGGILTNRWPIVYSRSRPAFLNRFTFTQAPAQSFDFTVITGGDMSLAALDLEKRSGYVVDFCAGKGYTAQAAHRMGLPFAGVELNAKRAGHILSFWKRMGYEVKERP